MRLDKYLAQSTGFSRKEVKRMLHAGEVKINGEPEKNAARHLSETDEVELDGMHVDAPSTRYIMLNKPDGCVCANEDPTYPTVVSLIELPRADELKIAGRLDMDTTGLVLLTDDGKWAHRVTSPRHKAGKVYHVTTAEPLQESDIQAFEKGIKLESEPFPTKPAKLEILSSNTARVTLFEGRYHQVKRMFAARGNRVEALHRESIGSIVLDDALFDGEYRFLTEEEINSI